VANSVFDELQILSCFHSHHRTEVDHEDPGKTSDVAEWGAQIMGDGVGKGLQFMVGGLKLLGTFGYPVFQIFIECSNLEPEFGRFLKLLPDDLGLFVDAVAQHEQPGKDYQGERSR
jgi:hypothetical protein